MPKIQTTRRSLVKGAAWSVPVVAMATPAVALPVGCSVDMTLPGCTDPIPEPKPKPGEACKFSGGSCGGYKQAYRFVFCFDNYGDAPITVYFPLITFADGRSRTPSPSSVSIPGDVENYCVYVIADNMGNSANGQGTLHYTYSWTDADGVKHDVKGTVGTGVNDLPPCPDCADVYGQAGPAMRSAEEEADETEATVEETTDAAAETTEATVEEAPATETVVEPAPAVDGAATTAQP